jgi:hypothetical protein
MRRWAAALVLATALAVPAAPARAAGLESPGELVGVWEGLWQWVVEALAPVTDPDAAKVDRSSYIDPNG